MLAYANWIPLPVFVLQIEQEGFVMSGRPFKTVSISGNVNDTSPNLRNPT
jgi:hypothetical protein